MTNDTAVVYLARDQDGPESFQRFARSYRKFNAGHAHDLVIVLKGFNDPAGARASFAKMFDRANLQFVSMSDQGFDITAYLRVAAILENSRLCFFNTFSEILAPHWLSHLTEALNLPGVGIAGGTASYQSLNDSSKLITKIIWLCQNGIKFDFNLYQAWKEEIDQQAGTWGNVPLSRRVRHALRSWLWGPSRRRHGREFDESRAKELDEKFEEVWKNLSSEIGPAPVGSYPLFPNPHVRTNGFLIDRNLFLDSSEGYLPTSKLGALAFESSPRSLTAHIMKKGLRPILVDNVGKAYDIDEWRESETFRLGRQRKLLFADNQTRNYDEMNKARKIAHTRMTWGDDIAGPRQHFDLGVLFSLPDFAVVPYAELSKESTFNSNLVERIRRAYLATKTIQPPEKPSVWEGINSTLKMREQVTLEGGDLDKITSMLANPASGNLFYGFENCFEDFVTTAKSLPEWNRECDGKRILADLTTLAEAVGAVRCFNPEQTISPTSPKRPSSVEEVLNNLQIHLGARVEFANPFPGEWGIRSSAGLISYRAIQALYQAWRLKVLSRSFGGKILEIGGGLGRTAYFAAQLGLHDFTIVDLPLTNVAQAAFLGSTLGSSAISLQGEDITPGTVRIIVPEQLFSESGGYDIVVNADSLPEMPVETAERYAEFCTKHSKVLLSMNHEVGEQPVSRLPSLLHKVVSRHPYWMRSGYVEELFIM